MKNMATKKKNQEQTIMKTSQLIENKLNTLLVFGEWKPIALASQWEMVFTDVGLAKYDSFRQTWVLCDIHGVALRQKSTFYRSSEPIEVKPTIYKAITST